MRVGKLNAARVAQSKRAFSTRRVPPDGMRTLIQGDVAPTAGDLVLARITEIGKQTKIELTDGRRAHLFPGDEIVVSFGNRYAPDQYEAIIGQDLSPCDLVAAGGVAGVELSRHQRMPSPTKITPIGLIGDSHGQRLNLIQFRVEADESVPAIPALLSLGTSMNAGKTLTATSMVRGLKRHGFKVAALKITGTGAGNDMWIVRDAGADIALDFTDAGFATTYLMPVSDIERAAFRLLNYTASLGCEVAVIEIADGLQQLETAQLIQSEGIRRITLGTVFAAYDAMGAKCGVDLLQKVDHSVLAISGRLGRSPLAVREAELATGLRVFSPYELQDGVLVPQIRERAARWFADAGFPEHSRRWIVDTDLQSEAAIAESERPTAISSPPSDRVAAPLKAEIIDLPTISRPAPNLAQSVLERVAAHIMRSEVERLCGAPFGQTAADRTNRRNGYRPAIWTTPVGPIEIRVPRVRKGCYHPAFLGRRDELDQAFVAGLVAEVVEKIGGADVRAPLSKLVERLGGAQRDDPEMARLLSALGSLGFGKGVPARRNGTPSAAFSEIAAPPNGVASPGPWIAVAQDAEQDDELSLETDGMDFEDDEVSIGAMFQAPHAIAGE